MLNWLFGRRAAPETPKPDLAKLPVVMPGARVLRLTQPYTTGQDVLAVQQRLRLTSAPSTLQTGAYDPFTAQAVTDFQEANDLLADGVVGPRTWAALGIVAPMAQPVVAPPPPPLYDGTRRRYLEDIMRQSRAGADPFAAVPASEIADWALRLDQQMELHDMRHPWEIAMFMANILHETGGFRRMVENLNYDEAGLKRTWPLRFNDTTAKQYARNPFRIAEKVYGGRMGNGPEGSGDGFRYRGHGPIQTTGKTNHNRIGALVSIATPDVPAYLLTRDGGIFAALRFWQDARCGDLARTGNVVDVRRRVNGGLIGIKDVQVRFATYKEMAR